jgi:hypothetical protein
MLRMRRQPQETAAEEVEVFPSGVTSETFWWWPWQTLPSNATTTDEDEVWNSGRFPPASISFTFNAPFRCTRIELLPRMDPKTGTVVHEIRTGSDVFNYRGCATDNEWIKAAFGGDGLRVKSVEILTLQSPSWVAWRRVRFWKSKVK